MDAHYTVYCGKITLIVPHTQSLSPRCSQQFIIQINNYLCHYLWCTCCTII